MNQLLIGWIRTVNWNLEASSLFRPQPQLRAVDPRLHGGGVRHRLSGSLGSDVPVQSSRGHRGASAVCGGKLRLLRQVTHLRFKASRTFSSSSSPLERN